MSDRNRPSREFLAELGWISLRWAGVETHFEILCAYVFHFDLQTKEKDKPPKPFGAKLKLLRRVFRSLSIYGLRAEAKILFDEAKRLSEQRNELLHSVVLEWSGTDVFDQTQIIIENDQYFAVQGKSVKLSDLRSLSKKLTKLEHRIFNFTQRTKSIVKLTKLDESFLKIGRLNE